MSTRLSWLGPLLLVSCSGPTLTADLEAFCKVAQEADRDASMSAEDKLKKVDARGAEYKRAIQKPGEDVWGKLAVAPLDKKHSVLVAAGEAAGKKGWHCTAYERMVSTVVAQQLLKQQKEEQERAAAAEALRAEAAKQAPPPKPVEQEKPKKKKAKKKRRPKS
ncbi:MAG: hypothetical protein HYV07_10940 [Deltaproteobacteria bacterium]|nr:hypothetical protein [Deltaproteobacteria bacterium]